LKIHIMTLFPNMFENYLKESLIGKAIDKKILSIDIVNIRDYALGKAKSVDDYVYGGGSGMLMQVKPIVDCYRDIVKDRKVPTYYLSPRGKLFDQSSAVSMAKFEEIVFICGHYEGIDERAIILTGAKEISIGDFVLTGGELPCMVVIDTMARFVDGVLSNSESVTDESFSNFLLEYPQYSRPSDFEGYKVPEILLSGDHKKVEEWRKEKSLEITKANRPDLYEKYIENN